MSARWGALQFPIIREASEGAVPAHMDRGAVVPFATQPLSDGRGSSARAAVAGPALNVLVIDGAPEERRAVRVALEGGGFALQEAANAESGLKLAGSATFDCILIDDLLPDAIGLDVLESLRHFDGALPCAVVVLTRSRTADGELP
jgi:PleD family two-component response regulator